MGRFDLTERRVLDRTESPIDLKNRLQRGRFAPAHPSWVRLLAMLFVLVVGSVSTVEAVHIHGEWLPKNTATLKAPALESQGQGEEHCPLCVAMHSTLPATMHVLPEPVVQLVQAFAPRAISASCERWSFAMFSRPPPVAVWSLAVGTAS